MTLMKRKKRVTVIECYPSKNVIIENMKDAHLRNAVRIARHIGADLIVDEKDYLRHINDKYDTIILNYATGYAPFSLIKKIFDNNSECKKFWITNEYDLRPIECICKYDHEVVANFEKQPYTRRVDAFHFINLNLLLAKAPNPYAVKKYGCIYYGTFRDDRSKYFTEYLHKPMYLSTSEKNFKRYKVIGCGCNYIKKISWVEGAETLNFFKYSLYIEDEYTHKVFNHLANRFYEANFCNCIQFFDINCKGTVEKSELDFDPFFYVHNFAELTHKIDMLDNDKKLYNKYFAIQRAWSPWILKEREDMMEKLSEILLV